MKPNTIFAVVFLLHASAALASCPRKCHFNDLQPAPAVNNIPCPQPCQLYSCLKTFGPNLPAFGIGVACVEQGLQTESPPASPPDLDTIETCTGPVNELPFLSELLPEGPIPPCATATPVSCPDKCYFPIRREPESNFIPCPRDCKLYSCLKTFSPMLPAFGIGVACAKPGLPTAEPPEPLPVGEYNRRCDGEGPSGELPYLKEVLPEASVPPCPQN